MLRSLIGVARYLGDYLRFKSAYGGRIEIVPCLQDWHEEGGATKNEYFWQDLLVARMIFNAKPKKHVDIGSRVDGFVAHVASFRDIEVFDVRPISAKIPGVIFRQADLMQPIQEMTEYCDSISCLHALEHFGLGRYGDPIDPGGYVLGLTSMAKLLREGGQMYLSVPIGAERVEFNANRVFDPRAIINSATDAGLSLQELTVIAPGGVCSVVTPDESTLTDLAHRRYSLGIFVLTKSANSQHVYISSIGQST